MLVPSGADLIAGPTDRVGEEIRLDPRSDAGAYVDVGDDGELSFVASEVNAAALTDLGSLVDVTYTGDQEAVVWVSDDSDAVTFTSGGRSIESRDRALVLAPEETASIGLDVDTRGRSTVDVSSVTIRTSIREPGTEMWIDRRFGPGRAEFVFHNTVPERQVRLDLGGMNTDGSDGDLDAVEVTLTDPTAEERLVLERGLRDSEDPAFSVVTDGSQALLRFRIGHSFDNADVRAAALEFSVPRDRLADAGISPAAVTLYRFEGGTYVAQPATIVARTDRAVTYRAELSGFSTFVVAGPIESVSDSDAPTSTTRNTPTPTATATPTTTSTATSTPEQGAPTTMTTGTSTRTPTPEPASTATTDSPTPERTGTATQPPATPTATGTATADPVVEQERGLGSLPLVGLVLVVALLVVLAAVRRYGE